MARNLPRTFLRIYGTCLWVGAWLAVGLFVGSLIDGRPSGHALAQCLIAAVGCAFVALLCRAWER